MGKLFEQIIKKDNVVKGDGGLYIISSTKRNPNHQNDFKIGLSKNLVRRLDQYHLCMPRGFWIFDLLVIKEEFKKDVYKLEAKLHRKLKPYEVTNNVRKSKTEWFRMSEKKMKAAVKEFYEQYKNSFREHKWEWEILKIK